MPRQAVTAEPTIDSEGQVCMADRIPLVVEASDPVSRSGVVSELRMSPDVRVLPPEDRDEAQVAVIVTDHVDTRTTQAIQSFRRSGDVRVVLVVSGLDDAGVLTAAEAGVSGLVRRCDASGDRLSAAVRRAARGEGTVPADLLARLLDQVGQLQRNGATNTMLLAGFTEREIEVLRLVADGCDTAEIAHRLAYSQRTIKNVIHDVTSRFNLRNRAHAIAYALRAGVI